MRASLYVLVASTCGYLCPLRRRQGHGSFVRLSAERACPTAAVYTVCLSDNNTRYICLYVNIYMLNIESKTVRRLTEQTCAAGFSAHSTAEPRGCLVLSVVSRLSKTVNFAMPNIINEVKLDFKDVLLRPKRSTLKTRAQVSLCRTQSIILYVDA